MTTTSLPSAGPAEEARRNHPESLEALLAAVQRSDHMWQRVPASDVPVPRLDWTAGETAAHMVGDLRDYTELLKRYESGYLTHADRTPGPPWRLSAKVNARHLTEIPERKLHRLAAMMENAAAEYVDVASRIDSGAAILTPNGLLLEPAAMTGLLLAEQLIHGRDIGLAANRSWSISAEDALLVIPAVLTVAPSYLRPSRARLRVSFELRMRGGGRYRMAVRDGDAVVGTVGMPTDCTITADPVAFLLLGFGRIAPWSPMLRGKIRPGGRKPWVAAKFGTLLATP